MLFRRRKQSAVLRCEGLATSPGVRPPAACGPSSFGSGLWERGEAAEGETGVLRESRGSALRSEILVACSGGCRGDGWTFKVLGGTGYT